MKKTSKIIISFAVAIAVVATVLIVAVFKKDEAQNLQPSVIYTLQPTINTIPADTNAYVDINALASDLVSDTDAALTSPTIFGGGVTVPGTGTSNITQFIYVDQNGNVIDPNNLAGTVVIPQNGNSGGNGDVMEDATMTPDNSQANDDVKMERFVINSQGLITEYLDDSPAVFIPGVVNGKTVTGIADGCFANSNITSVHIPETAMYIGARAFENCAYLRYVSFANLSTKRVIGDLAFQGCTSLKDMRLPVVTKIGNSAFGRCTSLNTVIFEDGSEAIGDYCFTDCKALASVTIPASVTNIGAKIFYNCNFGSLTVRTKSGSDAETYAENYHENYDSSIKLNIEIY